MPCKVMQGPRKCIIQRVSLTELLGEELQYVINDSMRRQEEGESKNGKEITILIEQQMILRDAQFCATKKKKSSNYDNMLSSHIYFLRDIYLKVTSVIFKYVLESTKYKCKVYFWLQGKCNLTMNICNNLRLKLQAKLSFKLMVWGGNDKRVAKHYKTIAFPQGEYILLTTFNNWAKCVYIHALIN